MLMRFHMGLHVAEQTIAPLSTYWKEGSNDLCLFHSYRYITQCEQQYCDEVVYFYSDLSLVVLQEYSFRDVKV